MALKQRQPFDNGQRSPLLLNSWALILLDRNETLCLRVTMMMEIGGREEGRQRGKEERKTERGDRERGATASIHLIRQHFYFP